MINGINGNINLKNMLTLIKMSDWQKQVINKLERYKKIKKSQNAAK